mmetsp:Transcript_28312/g.57749  ORF Transcript_28312/g.57749 Transcript_28312/m.57749 type:complete len:119 (+) Transcript_28312:26-382(+)
MIPLSSKNLEYVIIQHGHLQSQQNINDLSSFYLPEALRPISVLYASSKQPLIPTDNCTINDIFIEEIAAKWPLIRSMTRRFLMTIFAGKPNATHHVHVTTPCILYQANTRRTISNFKS